MNGIVTIWNGTQAEGEEFSAAALRYCTCDQPSKKVCATHQAMKTDQMYLDTLVFYRRNRNKLNAEEGLKDNQDAE